MSAKRTLPRRRFSRDELAELLAAPCQEDFEELLGGCRTPPELGKYAVEEYVKRLATPDAAPASSAHAPA